MWRFIYFLTIIPFLCGCAPAPVEEWELVFSDPGSGDWTERWFLEGAKASVENSEAGMVFNAGPIPGENASHAVLWTQRSFEGDLKIEYEYTRLDTMMATTSVNILFIQATGLGTEDSPTDILQSTHQRTEPWMKYYYLNMNTLHVSYSTTGPRRARYVSSRRYPAQTEENFGEGTQIQPIYDDVDLFSPGDTYQITVVKQDTTLTFIAEREGQTHEFAWNTTAFPPIQEGRIGLRHMWARSSRYKNFTVYQRKTE